MVEGGSLENCYTRKGIVGSNPTLSANLDKPDLCRAYLKVSHSWDENRLGENQDWGACELPYTKYVAFPTPTLSSIFMD